MSQQTIPPNPEFELNRRYLLLRRQAEHRHGVVLIMFGIVYFLLAPVYLMPLLFLHGRWIAGEVIGISGTVISMYLVFSGLTTFNSSRRSVTSRDIHQQRRESRVILYQLAHGELPPYYTPKGRAKTLFIGCIMTISGLLTLLFFLIDIPELSWVWILLGGVVILVELMLVLDALFLRAKEARELPTQSAQELSLLLAFGELTAGELLDEQSLGEK
jgi:O-antigen/teichoic acid export membrane protein